MNETTTRNLLIAGALVIGLGAGYGYGQRSIPQTNISMSPAMEMSHGTPHQQQAMDSMTMNLQGKDGDDFDKAFLTEMIIHHQGAIDMAKLAQEHGQHAELKTLANNIITAQTSEIDQMKQWLSQWFNKAE